MASSETTRAEPQEFWRPRSLNRVLKKFTAAGTISGTSALPCQPVIPPAPLTGDVGRGCGDASRALLFCFAVILLANAPSDRPHHLTAPIIAEDRECFGEQVARPVVPVVPPVTSVSKLRYSSTCRIAAGDVGRKYRTSNSESLHQTRTHAPGVNDLQGRETPFSLSVDSRRRQS